MTIDPVTGGGTANRTMEIASCMQRAGAECKILATDQGLSGPYKAVRGEPEVVLLPCLVDRLYLPFFSWKAIKGLVAEADIIHLMSHWTVINIIVYVAVKWLKKPYTVCPAGALQIFGRSKILKWAYNIFIGRRIIKNADACIAITAREADDYTLYGVVKRNVTVIPNGIDKSIFCKNDSAAQIFRHKYGLEKNRFILFVGRLNPIKGPDLLLKAFVSIEAKFPDYHLLIAGPNEGMKGLLQSIVDSAGLQERVHLVGYVGGADKVGAYCASDLLVIPSRREAMSIVALEAGACGTPVLLTDECGFDEVREAGCAVVPPTMEGIRDGLTQMLSTKEGLEKAGDNLMQIVLSKYTWEKATEKYLSIYNGQTGACNPLNVLCVNMTIDPVSGGGVANRTVQLARYLNKQGAKATILTTSRYIFSGSVLSDNVGLVVLPCLNNRYYIPFFSYRKIKRAVEDADVIQLMSHWSLINVFTYFMAKRMKKPYVVCPAGALIIFGRSKWKKRLYNFLIGRKMIREASARIATTVKEKDEFRNYGISDDQVTVIPNGVDDESYVVPRSSVSAFKDKYGLIGHRYILFAGRMNSIKGPDILIEAFARIHAHMDDCHLVFIGNDEGMAPMVRGFAGDQGIEGKVHFLGFLEGHEKACAFHGAELLVVPSRSEVMSIVALEAALCRTPVLLTDRCGFNEIEAAGAGRVVEATAESIGCAVKELLDSPNELHAMGRRAYEFVKGKYSWNIVVHQFLSFYEAISGLPAKGFRG